MNSTGKKLTIASSFLLALCVVAAPVDAQQNAGDATNASSTAQVGSSDEKCKRAVLPQDRDRILCIDEATGGDFDLPMQRGKLTTIRFPHELKGGTKKVEGLDIQVAGRRVVILQTARRVRGNFFIHSKTGYTVAFDPEIIDPKAGDSDKKPPRLYIVVTLAEMERRQAEAQKREEEHKRQREREARERQTQARYRTAEQVLHSVDLGLSRTQRHDVRASPLVIERITWDGNDPYVRFSIEDLQVIRPSDIAEIRISNGETDIPADIVVIETPGDRDNRLPATILPGKKVEGVVWIPETFEGHPASLTMSIHGKNGLLLYADQIGDYTVRLVSKEEYERHEAALRRARQLVLGPSFALGACWLSDGQDENNLDATDCFVFGMRLTKGITEMIAFEVEATGGWTGDADFDNGTRSSRFGRFSLGGVLRFGHDTIPYARLAIGGQGTSYDGLDSGFEIALSYAVGVGLQRRIGKQFIAGADVAIGSSTDNAFRILQAGVQLAYSWSP